MSRRLTLLDRAFIRRHRARHGRLGGVRVAWVSVPSWDPAARGLLCQCVCGKVRAR